MLTGLDNMSRFRFFLSCACLLGFTNGFNRDEWLTEIKNMDLRFDADQWNNNLTDLVSIHADDMIVMPPGLPAIYGIEEYRKAQKENRTGEDLYFIKHIFEDIVFFTEDTAVFRLEAEVKLQPDSETKVAKVVVVLRKSGGHTLEQVVIWNYNS